MAEIEMIEPVAIKDTKELDVAQRALMNLFEQYVKSNRKLPPELLATLAGIEEPGRFADTVSAHLSIRLSDKQKLLETIAIDQRIDC